MVIETPGLTRAVLETEVLKRLRATRGCEELQAVGSKQRQEEDRAWLRVRLRPQTELIVIFLTMLREEG